MTTIQSHDDAKPWESDTRRGSNLLGVRNYNERLIIDIIRQNGVLSKADIARITKLSAQTVTVIVNNLIENGLLRKNPTERGRVGQPSTPIGLNSDGATSIGIKVGRRSVDILTAAFTTEIIQQESLHYEYPDADVIFDWIGKTVAAMITNLTPIQRDRLTGVGVATPSFMNGWEGIIQAPKGAMQKWQGIDVRSQIEAVTGLETHILNDATAACLAELKLAQKSANKSFLYFYIGTFLGGGIVVDGKLLPGKNGNAGSAGSMPQRMILSVENTPKQMVEVVAKNDLEATAIAAGYQRQIFSNDQSLTVDQMKIFDEWAIVAANGLAFAILSGQAFLDTDSIIIDGHLSPHLLENLISKTKAALSQYDEQGITMPTIVAGQFGVHAKVMGGAILPLYESFGTDDGITLRR